MNKTKSGLLFLVVFGFLVFTYFPPKEDAVPQQDYSGEVLGSSVVQEDKESIFRLFLEGLISKRNKRDDSKCVFVVSEESGGTSRIWEGELIWQNVENYKISLDGRRRIFLVNRGQIYAIEENGNKEHLGGVDDNSSGSFAFREISNYIFENFLVESAADPENSILAGEEKIDGVKYFIIENIISIPDSTRSIRRKFWVSEEGVFFRAKIEDRIGDYEVYNSAGTAVVQKGYVRNIDIEVKNRIFF